MKKLLIVLAILALATSAHANLLLNAGFEDAAGAPIPNWTGVGLGPSYAVVWEANNAIPGLTGSLAAQYISWGGDEDAGYIYQQVSGVTVGALLDAYVEYAWYCGGGFNPGDCGIGIDPTGGTDWNAASVVKQITAPASQGTWYGVSLDDVVAQSDTVTMFIYDSGPAIAPTWWAKGWDNASLTAEVIPEPASLLAFGTGLFGLIGLRRRS